MNLDNRHLDNPHLDNRPRAYAELESRFHRWTALKDGHAVLQWD